MIIVCPHCGSDIPEILKNGIASCVHCKRIFDSSTANQLLSAAWLLIKKHYNLEQLISITHIQEHEAILAFSFIENEYTMEEFQNVIKKLGIT